MSKLPEKKNCKIDCRTCVNSIKDKKMNVIGCRRGEKGCKYEERI